MKKIFFDEKKYKKLIVIFSVIVLIISMHTFTFDAYTASNCTEGEPCALTSIVNTKNIIQMNLYDYEEGINNKHFSDNYYPGFRQLYGVTDAVLNSWSQYGDYAFIMNGNSYLSIKDVYYIGETLTTDYDEENGKIGSGLNAANDEIVGVEPINLPSKRGAMYNKLINGFPALRNQNSLEYLFPKENNPNIEYVKKQNDKNISHLFQYNEATGTYFYNSLDNHAEFDPIDDRFIVYDKKITPSFIRYPFGNFMPFNKINEQTTQIMKKDENNENYLINASYFENMYKKYENSSNSQYKKLYNSLKFLHLSMSNAVEQNYTALDVINRYYQHLGISLPQTLKNDLHNLYAIDYDEVKNFFFGFDMKFNFEQPVNGKVKGEDMIFRFDGDDDVWVYIDDVLFLDLSGIHAQVGGEIDFAKGEVRYYRLDESTNLTNIEISKYNKSFAEISGIDKSKLKDLGNGKYGTFKDNSEHTLNFYYMERGASSGVMSMKFNMLLKPLVEENEIKITKKLASSDVGAIGDNKYYFQIAKPNSTDTITDDELFIEAPFEYDVYDSSNNKIKTVQTDENGIIILEPSQYAVVSGILEDQGEYYVRELIDKDIASVKVNDVNKLSNNSPSKTIDGKDYILVASDANDIFDGDGEFVFENDINLGSLKLTKKLGENTSSGLLDEYFKFYVTIDDKPLKVGTSYQVGTTSKSVSEEGIIQLKPTQEAIIEKIVLGSKFEVTERLASNSGLIASYEINNKSTNSGTINGEVSIIITNTEKPGTYIEIPIHKTTTNSDGIKYTYNFKLYDVDSKEAKSISIKVNERGIGEGKFRIDYSQIDNKDEENEYNYQIYEEKVDSDKTTIYDKSIYDVKVIVKNDSDGFIASYTVSKNNKKVENDNIVFNNIKTFELPKTGSSGMLVITFAGIIFISISFISLFQKKKIGVN